MEGNTETQQNLGECFNAAPLPQVKPKTPRRVFAYQLLAFFLTALLYSLSHALRTVWGYIKPYISNSNPYYTTSKLGMLDFTFMTAYAVGQYVNGWLGDRVNLKIFITAGMGCAATGLCLFGYLEGFAHLNNIFIDMLAFILNGLGQSTGYPTCVSIVGNWFPASSAGTVFGLWGTNLNIGDIIGQQIGRIVIDQEGLSWPYAIFFTVALLGFFLINLLIFVKVHPKDIQAVDNNQTRVERIEPRVEVSGHRPQGHGQGISFFDAWKIKNVPSYAFAFFCVKGVMYGVLFWLPFYLKNDVGLDGDISLILASIEIGQLCGSIMLGYLSDRIKSRAIMITFGFFFSVIFLIFTYMIKSIQVKSLYFVLLFLAGIGVGGPASLIGGAVSSDLGQKLAKKSSVSAVSTIAGIMEGCGASGAALTSLFVSIFTSVTFPLFAGLCFTGGLVMLPIAVSDYKKLKRQQLYPDMVMSSDSEAEVNNQNF